MVWAMRLCLVFGLCLLGMSAPFTGTPNAAAAPAGWDCIQSWICQGTVSNCALSAGRVPSCWTVNYVKTCSYGVSGYICTGTDINTGGPCSVGYNGCQ